MKKMSVFQIVLLAVFGALAVGGVLIFALAVGSNSGSGIGPVVVWGTLDQTAFTTVLRQATDANAQLAQVTYVHKDPQTFQSGLTQALASGGGPDLVLLEQDEVVKDAGFISGIPTSVMSQSQFDNTFIAAASPFSWSSGSLGFPVLSDPLVLYWNKDMLAGSGFSQPPEYWDQLYAMAQKMRVVDSSGNIQQSAIALGEYANVDNAKDILAALILQAGGEITGLDSSGKLTSELIPKNLSGTTTQAAAGSALTFFTQFADPSQSDYSWNASLPTASQAFAAGDTALYIGYASEEAAIAKANPNLNFGIAALPQVRSAAVPLTVARVYAFAATRTSKNPTGALTAAADLATAANSEALSQALGIPSARRDVLAQASQAQIPSQLVSSGDICKGADPVVCSAQMAVAWVDPDPDATASIFQAMIEDTTSGAQLYTAAIQRADQQLTSLLSQLETTSTQ